MVQFIVLLIVIFIFAMITGKIIRYVRSLLTPNKDVRTHNRRSKEEHSRIIEDIPYEEIKEKK